LKKPAADLRVIPPEPPPIRLRSGAVPPPKHLSAASKAWWRGVTADYVLEPHHLRLLQCAAEAWDRMTAAREAISEHGMIYVDQNGGPKSRPEVAIERDSRLAFARLVRELDLDVEAPLDRSRPPPLRSNRRS
jgi:P27 family predicted phage terminase small subunit